MTIGMKNYKEMEICGSMNVVLYFRELAHMLLGDFVPGDVRGLRNKTNKWLISLCMCVCVVYVIFMGDEMSKYHLC